MTKQRETRDQVLELIERLGVGEAIPSERQLSVDLGVSRLTVRAALDDLIVRLNDGQGTLGQLLKDKQLYENMNKTVDDFRGLLAAIKQDPKKYLNVKVSIF